MDKPTFSYSGCIGQEGGIAFDEKAIEEAKKSNKARDDASMAREMDINPIATGSEQLLRKENESFAHHTTGRLHSGKVIGLIYRD